MASGYGRGYSGSRDERKGKGSGSKNSKNKSDRSSQGYYKGAQIQNVKAARVYVFGDDDVAEEDENVEFEMPEMRSRKGTSHLWQEKDNQPEYFEKEIDEGETLQAIALKYACTVSDLKRLNNLIQDQEFFGLRVLKVPMKKYGVLSEQYGNNSKDSTSLQHSKHTNGAAFSPDSDYDMQTNYYDESDSQHDFSDPDTQAKIMRTLSIRENISSQGKEAEKFLLKMDADLSKFKQSSRSERESLSEVISVLTNKSIHPLQTSRPNNKVNGATCGISWKSIICIAVSIAVLMPLIYLFYIEYIYKREAKDEHLNDTSP